jgi:hypothetical protein
MNQTRRENIRNLIIDYSQRTGKTTVSVWADLYDAFEYHKNIGFKRMAHNQERKVLDIIQDEGFIGEFETFVMERLENKPPLAETKPETNQGELL